MMFRLSVRCLVVLAALWASFGPLRAQVLGIPGANHPELKWQQVETEHFILIYHDGLDSIARVAAPIAEEVYRVVTTNLQTPLPHRIRIYLSDNDEIRNAFAFDNDYIFVWMRGILDDNLYSFRASGTSKWLRTVLTHEFTHIVIAQATHTWINTFLPVPGVPRWFNEGMARYMEPDGWTTDLDIALREATVSGKLDLESDDYLYGMLVYEGGQSLVRYIAATYGDSALVAILKWREKSLFPYSFEKAVEEVTKHSLRSVYDEWHKVMNVYYNTQYGQKEDVRDVAREVQTGLGIVAAARLSPDGKRIAMLGSRTKDAPAMLYVMKNDEHGNAELVTREPGIQPSLAWSADGRSVIFSKVRFGEHNDLIYDLFRCDIESGSLTRLSSDARLEYPDVSPDGKSIVCARFTLFGSDLVVMDADGLNMRELTRFHDVNVDVYAPRWSPDGKRVAFSIFRKNGKRDIATVSVAEGTIVYVTDDSSNDRYPIWSSNGEDLALLSFRNGIPNLFTASPTANATLTQITNVASNILPVDWPAKKDSILVTSFSSRNSVRLYWMSAKHPTPIVNDTPKFLEAKYTSWRSMRWPLITPSQDSIAPVATSGPYGHNSLANISALALIPMIASDIGKDGDRGLQYGLIGVFADDLHKHVITGIMMYGAASRTFNYAIDYANNQLAPTILAGATRFLNFDGRLFDIDYFEQVTSFHLGINVGLHTPNSLDDLHDIYFGGVRTQFDPWNISDFDLLDPAFRPITTTIASLNLNYAYISPFFTGGIGAARADAKIGSDLTYTRAHLFFNWSIPIDELAHSQLVFIGRATAQEGDEVPQDLVGFSSSDNFEGGFTLVDLHVRERLRGIRRNIFGNRMVRGSVELRSPDNFFRELVPMIGAWNPQLVEFFDVGSAWYASAPPNDPLVTLSPLSQTHWMRSAGIELRSGVPLGFNLAGGVGWELVPNAPADWFFRLETPF